MLFEANTHSKHGRVLLGNEFSDVDRLVKLLVGLGNSSKILLYKRYMFCHSRLLGNYNLNGENRAKIHPV